jgi:hypothetical protein
MTNPYAPSQVTPELAQEERKRPKMWRSLLLAYGVHHVFSWLGFLSGLLVVPGSEWQGIFPPDRPAFIAAKLCFFPLVMDGRTLFEPLLLDIVSPTVPVVRWIRWALLLTVPVAVIAFVLTKRQLFVYWVGVSSFLLGLLFFVTIAIR